MQVVDVTFLHKLLQGGRQGEYNSSPFIRLLSLKKDTEPQIFLDGCANGICLSAADEERLHKKSII